MMKKKMSNNGITLIALVITIIILLILAGVTINLTLGENGIFRTAEMAGKNYTQAQEQELAGLANFENTIDNIIAGTGNDIGQEGGSGTDTPEVTEKLLKDVAKPGDYVKYTPANKTFTMKVDGMSVTENGQIINYTQVEDGIATGYDEEQTFNTNDYTGLWQVLYNDEEHGLQIISADVVTENLYLGNDTDEEKAKIGYNNYVDTLNAFCNNYTDIKYAVSGRSVGSDPLNPKDTIADTYTLPFEYNGSKESGFKVKDDNKYFDNEAMNSAISQNSDGIDFINKDYWLASRYGLSGITSNNASIYVSIMPDSGAPIRFFCVLYPDNSSNPYGTRAGVRPVITLKSGIQTSSGNGSESSPYELVAM